MAEKRSSESVEETLGTRKSDTKDGNILQWSSGEDFTIERGQNAIEKIVQGWDLSESWKHCIDYIGTTEGGRQLGRAGGEGGGEEEGGEGGEGGEVGKKGREDHVPSLEKKLLHCYRVLWSEPTRRKPVPVATAAVYFFLHSSFKTSMDIFYTLEGQKLVHRPAGSSFREVWLRRIIQHKLTVTTTTPGWAPNRTITHPVAK